MPIFIKGAGAGGGGEINVIASSTYNATCSSDGSQITSTLSAAKGKEVIGFSIESNYNSLPSSHKYVNAYAFMSGEGFSCKTTRLSTESYGKASLTASFDKSTGTFTVQASPYKFFTDTSYSITFYYLG